MRNRTMNHIVLTAVFALSTILLGAVPAQAATDTAQAPAESTQTATVDPLHLAAKEPGDLLTNATASLSNMKKKEGPSVLDGVKSQGELGETQTAIFGGAQLVMLASQSSSQMMSFLIQTSQGHLIVIDGGLPADAEYLLNQIRARGGHVSAWLVTHPQGDHVGALYTILQNQNNGISIDGIYYNFADLSWYQANDPNEIGIESAIIATLGMQPQEMLHVVSKGQEIWVDDVKIQVMNDRYDIPGTYAGNDGSIVYKATVNGKTILFLGDLAEQGGNRLLLEAGAEALKSDIVQMSHHGQRGVNETFYKAVAPSICLWPTPLWLWNNDAGNGVGSGSWLTNTNKTWMSKLGVQIHYCTKDGDQVIY